MICGQNLISFMLRSSAQLVRCNRFMFEVCQRYGSVLRRSDLFIPSQRLAKVKGTEKRARSVDMLEKAGYIRQTAAGIYSFLPLGQNVLERLTTIIDKHMKKIKGQKLQMPALTPSALWIATNRWNTIGDELIRVTDRNGQQYCLGPTHEESFTELVASVPLSPKSLPLRLYQISPKYRDEMRPRSGLLRCKEFLMKDMYSFDSSKDAAMQSYETVFNQYLELFKELELPVVPVAASAGTMGGSHTHEFQVLNETGEDTVVTCSCGKNACNVEIATRKASITARISLRDLHQQIADETDGSLSGYKTVVKMVDWMNSMTPKEDNSMIDFAHYIAKVISNKKNKIIEQYHDVFVIRDSQRSINEIQLSRKIGETVLLFPPSKAKEEGVQLSSAIHLFVDWSVHDAVELPSSEESELTETTGEFICNWGDYTQVLPNDPCRESGCEIDNGTLTFQKGIEVGQTFYLGDKYSSVMKANFHDYSNASVPLEMGCYGLGVSRILQAVVEYYQGDNGIVWPLTLAPYLCVVIPIHPDHLHDCEDFAEAIKMWCPQIGEKLFLDDRFKGKIGDRIRDAEMIGASNIIIVGHQWVKSNEIGLIVNTIERQYRADKTMDSLKAHFLDFHEQLKEISP